LILAEDELFAYSRILRNDSSAYRSVSRAPLQADLLLSQSYVFPDRFFEHVAAHFYTTSLNIAFANAKLLFHQRNDLFAAGLIRR
jgi:hypothetical protein